MQLLSADGRLIARQGGVPGGGYAPTVEWQVGLPVVDRRGLVLPAQLAPGEFGSLPGCTMQPAGNGSPCPIGPAPLQAIT